eukprot:scaffold2713_cov104-Skeletonema_marinoi.AAC.1
MSSNSKETTIILSDWIRRALVGVDLSALAGERCVSSTTYGTDPSQWSSTIRNSMALCSDDYLMPALRVAYSLANQICKEEATGKSPTLSVDWVDNIVVHSNNRVGCESMNVNDDGGHRDSLDSIAFLDSLGFDPSDAGGDNFADNLFESVINDHDSTTLSEEERDEGIEGGCGDYIRAQFASSLFNTNDDNDGGLGRDAMQRIYSLGVVFYVLFSGGERPAAHFSTAIEFVEQKLSGKSDTETEELSQELPEDLDPLPFEHAPIDLAGELSILDGIGDDEYVQDPLGDNNFDDAPQHPNPKKRQSSQQNRNISNSCSVPVDSLREKGLPSPLCDLVANMLDCTNASLSGEDSYQSMSDVRSDLRLMLHNPNTFL